MKKLIFTIPLALALLLLFPLVSYGIEMSEINIGDRLYFDGFMDNPKVTVLDKDYSDNTVRIKKSNGSTEWVNSSQLMGSTGKVFDDMLQDIGKEIIKSAFESALESSGSSQGEKGFILCNETGASFHAVIGMNSAHDGIVTHGHFPYESGECSKLVTGSLQYRYYYVYLSKNGENLLDVKNSDRLLCVDPVNAFEKTHSEGRCSSGQKNVYFRTIDTGETSRAFKYTIN
jgi:uncharacterized membrane protein